MTDAKKTADVGSAPKAKPTPKPKAKSKAFSWDRADNIEIMKNIDDLNARLSAIE